jgi:hypothetical protein
MEPKKLIFGPPYPSILFTGEKTKTFRVTGGNRYQIGDLVSLCTPEKEEFAQAAIFSKTRKRFYDLTTSDWKGHETFASEREMYIIYSNWQGFPVGGATPLDIIEYKDFRITNPDLISRLKQGIYATDDTKGNLGAKILDFQKALAEKEQKQRQEDYKKIAHIADHLK